MVSRLCSVGLVLADDIDKTDCHPVQRLTTLGVDNGPRTSTTSASPWACFPTSSHRFTRSALAVTTGRIRASFPTRGGHVLHLDAAEHAMGPASGSVSRLEVVEADFSKNLAQITTGEEAAVAEYSEVKRQQLLSTAR